MRSASKPLFYGAMTQSSPRIVKKFFGAVRVIVWLCESCCRVSSKTAPHDRRWPRKGSIEPSKRFYRTPKRVLSNPKKVLSNLQGSIEPLLKGSSEPQKRFYQTPKGSIKPPGFYRTPSERVFRTTEKVLSNLSHRNYPFQVTLLKLSLFLALASCCPWA